MAGTRISIILLRSIFPISSSRYQKVPRTIFPFLTEEIHTKILLFIRLQYNTNIEIQSLTGAPANWYISEFGF